MLRTSLLHPSLPSPQKDVAFTFALSYCRFDGGWLTTAEIPTHSKEARYTCKVKSGGFDWDESVEVYNIDPETVFECECSEERLGFDLNQHKLELKIIGVTKAFIKNTWKFAKRNPNVG